MFMIEHINDVHAHLGSARTLPEYVRALKTLGVERYDSYLADGHSEYFGQGGHRVVFPPAHEVLVGNIHNFLHDLSRICDSILFFLLPKRGKRNHGNPNYCQPSSLHMVSSVNV